LPDVFVGAAGAQFDSRPDWWRDFEYPREEERGFDFREDLWTPGELHVDLDVGARLGLLVSTRDPAGRDGVALLQAEERRRAERLDALGPAPAFCRALAFDASQVLVRRGTDTTGDSLWTVIAGYPWFADWGRDTMIALPGLCLATRRVDEARGILRAFAGSVHQGLLPNRFLDASGSAPPEYNAVDAGLWFFVAVWRYLEATDDETFVLRTLLPVLRDMLAWHTRGTLHAIREDSDGLLVAGEGDDQLTWMDARIDGRPITPRHGKAVEIQALWINALAILAQLEARAGDEGAARELGVRERRARERFGEVFWYAEGGYLYDVADGITRDASLRPNQILALALPFPVLDRARGRAVLAAVERSLLTPRGLRTLAPDDPAYRGRYEGEPAERDAAYHQVRCGRGCSAFSNRARASARRGGKAPCGKDPRRIRDAPRRSGTRDDLRDLRRRRATHAAGVYRAGVECGRAAAGSARGCRTRSD
jgi:predicted glycogen debranching enzyme